MRTNVINLDASKDIKFCMVPVWIDYAFFRTIGEIKQKHIALIGLKDMTMDVEVIHPISDFIMENWKHREFNTQRKHANNTVKFLNYLLENKRKLNILVFGK